MVGREGELRPKMIRKMITIRLGDNKEGLIFDTTPVIVHLVETTRSNKVQYKSFLSIKDSPDTICAEISRHTNTWENVSNCRICQALNTFDTENGYASNIPPVVLGYYAANNNSTFPFHDGVWLTPVDSKGNTIANNLIVATRKEYYDENGKLHQKGVHVTDVKNAFTNETAIN